MKRPTTRSRRSVSNETEQRLHAILQTAVEGIITINQRGVIDSINPAAERIFGYRASEVIGQNVSLLMPSPDREQHDEYIRNYLRTGKAKIIGIGREVFGRRKDGSVFPLELSVSEVRLPRRRVFTGFIRDLTDRKRLEREILEISSREQRRIGQDLHDGLGQHLAGIELMSSVLEQGLRKSDSKLAPQAAKISGHVREAIRQTRALARGLSPVQMDAGGLMAALEDLAQTVTGMFRVKCSFACQTPVRVDDNAVATHLFRIAQEAVSNAIKHGHATCINISLARLPERVVLAVHDDGRGIPRKLPATRGLGLRIMQYRCGMIGGSLVVQRGENSGTSVVCSVHVKRTGGAP